jgi:hypothetical protein
MNFFGISRITSTILVLFVLGLAAPASAEVSRSLGQTIYVPAYSHIYYGIKESRELFLTVTLSIRNTDPRHPLILRSVQYFNTQGAKLREYVEAPVKIPPLGTAEYIIKQFDKEGGSGANFLLRWDSTASVTDPIAEAIMVGSDSQGVSFLTRGQVIEERTK